MAKLTVPVDDALLQRFRLVVVRERTSMSDVVRRLVEAYVDSKEKP